MTPSKLALAIAGMLLAASGCAAEPKNVIQRLQSEDPAERIGAAMDAANRNDAQAVPFLIDRLQDTDPDVRLFASMALERLTGQTMGWHFYESKEQRAPAVERWRAWLVAGRPAHFPASGPATQTGGKAAP